MAVDVVTEAVIGCDRELVSSYAADPANAPKWYDNIEQVRWETEPPLEVGSRATFVAHFLGKKLEYTYEVSQWKPGECLVMTTAEGPFPMETTYEWTDAPGGGTKMTLRNRGAPTGFGKLMGPVMASAMRRANEKDLEALKRILEASCAE